MPRPTVATVKALTARVKLPAGTAEKLIAHLERERTSVTVEADGYPSATMGGGTSGSGGDVTLTSVESAVEIRLSGATRRDDHRHHATAALRCLNRTVTAIDEMLGHLRALDLADKVDDPSEPKCSHHASVQREAYSGPSRTARERGLCDYCAEFADRHQGQRPPEVILERLAQGKRPTPQQIAHALGESFGVTALGARLQARASR